MKLTRIMMGMTITVEIVDPAATAADLERVFAYFDYIDKKFSVFKSESEISRINRGELTADECSDDMKEIFTLAARTKQETDGFFDIRNNAGQYDPSGLVKGWAISRAAQLIRDAGFRDFYVDAGGDMEVSGKNQAGQAWSVGIRNPFQLEQNVKILHLTDCGVATSGIYLRGQHIYDPHRRDKKFSDIVSLTVVGPDAYEADRFATAAFAMGRPGLAFLARRPGLEAYMIDKDGRAIFTDGLRKYAADNIDG